MKPVMLKIKGLNSFIEEQIIDFEKLTGKGLFGIFGHTGSGKSTILDAIIIALYGKIPRESTDYINTNCDRLTLSYEFEIAQGRERNRYVVERSIRKDKHGAYKTAYARIIEKCRNGECKIIAEKSTEVKGTVEKLIGLTIDDFTRSVVLPQGKFSEFLKLKGKERRNMLERIFALEKYGKRLGEKIRSARNGETANKNILEGELKKYEGFSEDDYKEKVIELNDLINYEKELRKEKEYLYVKYDKYNRIWELQNELKIFESEQQKLDSKINYINNKKDIVEKAKKALEIKPFIDALNDTKNKIEINQKELDNLCIKLKKIDKKLKEVEDKYREVQKDKDEKIPMLVKKESELNQAIEINDKVSKLEHDRNQLLEKYNSIKKDIGENEIKLEKIGDNIKKYTKKEEEITTRLQQIEIDPEFKEKVQMAYEKENKYNELKVEKEKIESNINAKQERVRELQMKYTKILEQQKEQNDNVLSIENKCRDLENNFPGDNNMLLEKQNSLNDLKETLHKAIKNDKKREEVQGKLDITILSKASIEKELIEINQKINYNKELIEISERKIEEIEDSNRASILAAKLKQGEPCPVCGSTHHINLAHDIDIYDLEEEKKLKKKLEKEIRELDKGLRELEKKFAAYEKEEEHLKNELYLLNEELKGINIEKLTLEYDKAEKELNNFKIKLNDYSIQKEKLYKYLSKEKDNKSKIDTEVVQISERLKNECKSISELNIDLGKINDKIDEISKEYFAFKEELGLDNVKSKIDEIKKFEKESNKLQKLQISVRKNIEESKATKEKLNKYITDLRIEMTKVIEIGKEKGENINGLKEQVLKLTDGKDAIEYLETIRRDIKNINKLNEEMKEQFELTKENQKNISENVLSRGQQIKMLMNLQSEQLNNLNALMKEKNFNSKEEVLNNIISESELKKFDTEIKYFEDNCKNVKSNICRIQKKLGNEKIEEHEWNDIKNRKLEVEQLLNIKIKEIATKQKVVDDMKEDLKKFKELKKREREIEHRLSLLNDLDKLVQGNRFVEFVAMNRLKYIAREASKRLKDITNNRYALEIDGEGNFTIRDDKNGGVVREISSLSGGETFLTSLALALALSSQIQLKGSAPLEFFFLDEGFGSLDSDLLEVVMTSLEKLHTDKLSVGIISHVEELKNRVPVKLIVTPAEPGEHGSKVKLEYS
ncbi:nuclease SbcCD subunit C [Clostridium tepidiprofundi DSM 19306]|uniref:Nuclease SbcCD subunit C n=1 Tax=Clostridium tepidiprofundi DSM 19306 TaxID=1121338 RepID=A0A151B2R6_9CLOT|nr:SbcC/MukB-like Walker B domain-containing protein [Clostridium tepidiprofundi]KYH34201.1 nuclease SbcCD subunit C [Clostridium tepidiprofundi DSM 19306]